MRMYGSVHISFWENSETQNLSDQAKLLAIYLLTGPHTNMAGVFRLPDGYIKEDLGWDIETVKNTFHELSQIDFLTRDDERGWLVIHQFLKWNPIQNPKQGVGIQKIFKMIPTQSSVLNPFVNGLLEYGKSLSEEFVEDLQKTGNGFETVSSNGATEQEQEQNQDQKQNNNFMSDSDNLTACKKQSFQSQAVEVLQFLNEKTGRAYRPVEANLKLIIARLKSGATPSECYQVIAKKSREWGGHAEMDQYLRPATLFNATKFEQYVGELVATDVSKVTA
ncbi:MAG TPA: conserved phage C-terminal domain-containing protein [Gammaproteobacteria bacterium]|nr:conserved phage C-terminal domain-containing protein [Gammaproteobacteria bacterium]